MAARNYDAEIICFCADIGQREELDGLEEKALATGATKCLIEDLRAEFARDFIFPMLRAGAIYEGQYFLGTSIARPLIAKRMVEIARAEGAEARGAFREEFPGRAEMITYATEHKIPVEASVAKPYSSDRNLLHISFERGILEDPWFDASGPEARDMYKLSVAPEDAPNEP